MYCNFILIPNDKAVRILLENASFRQVKKPARTSKSDVSSCEMEKCGEASTRISSRSRYDRFDTSPYISLYSIAKKRFSVNTFLPLRHGTAASHTQPGRFAFLGQKARFLCKKGCSFGREPSIIGTIFFKFEVQRREFQWHRQNKIWAPAASKS